MYLREGSMPLFDFVEWMGVVECHGVFCAPFLGLALGAPCIRPMYVGVPCFFTNLCIPSFTYIKKSCQ